ncbi:MAG: LLM class flavin-dependent oxidoreductase, partial [Chloroflexi bacterium]|nr:LLM class flavin-dependent oxidoreductase [Chloroflexota bacterium]
MELGIFIIATEYTIRIDELAREVEQRGFESLFLGEHSHIPVSRRSPFRSGAELPREYRHAFDPFVALATAAAVTTNHKAGV